VEYTAVYPGIDLVFYGNNHQLEYDFVLQPGADPRKIALDFAGTKNLAVDSAGNLAMETEAGKLTLFKPLVYQMVGGEKKQIRGGYVLHQDHSVGLDIGAHDSTKALVVDPVLVYSSYLGGSGWDSAVSVKVDATGNTYLGGFTISPDFPATTMISAEPGGNCVGFITKLDPTLSTVLFSSFFGGTNGITNCLFGDGIYSIAVDSLGQTYATGFASSTDFPITADSAFQPAMGAGATENAFISKLSADGQTMLYSSYLGGSGGNDDGYAVVLDASANAYVVGQATSPDFPLTTSITIRTIPSGVYPAGNGFLTRVDTTLTGIDSLVYSAVLGGTSGDDAITGIALDSNQNAILTGWTSSTDFPVTTSSAFQISNNSESYCGFVSRIDMASSGPSSLLYSSYLCGTLSDWGWGVALNPPSDPNTNVVYVTGEAYSADFPSTFAQTNSPNGKGFAAKLDLNLSGPASLVYSRLLGGDTSSFGDAPYRVAVDTNENAYVVGQTSSTDFPFTADAIQTTIMSTTTGDGFLTVLSPDGSAILYATYLGGSGTAVVGELGDFVFDVALDEASNIFMVGQTFSADFPTTDSGLQTTFGGGGDAFLTVLSALTVPGIVSISPPAGSVGIMITIEGSGFEDETASVTIGGIPAAVQSWSRNTIIVQVPSSLSAGSSPVVVTTVKESSKPVQFLVETGTPAGQQNDFLMARSLSTISISAGQSARYPLEFSSTGTTMQPIALTCSGLPADSTCSFSPNQASPSGSTPVQVILTVSTVARDGVSSSLKSITNPFLGLRHLWIAMISFVAIFLLLGLSWGQHQRLVPGFGLAAALLLLVAGCGGGHATSALSGTPAGAYTIVVTATSGSITHTTKLVLLIR